jgi:hypothetical protein
LIDTPGAVATIFAIIYYLLSGYFLLI